jgi:hypothetical protein
MMIRQGLRRSIFSGRHTDTSVADIHLDDDVAAMSD